METLGGFGHRLHQAWRGAQTLLPGRCAICRQGPGGPLCETCIARFAPPRPRCQRCALPVPEGVRCCGTCLRQPPPLQHCLAALDYAWPWRELLARFKFREQAGWDRQLAWLMRGAAGAEDLLHAVDRVLPIPLSRQRLAERGYNQSWQLARRLAPQRAEAHLLLRLRHSPPQRTLPRAQRLANLQGAFGVEPLRASELRGQHLLLVDDVMTSGASLHAAAQALLQAGAGSVSALVLARTGLDDSDSAT